MSKSCGFAIATDPEHVIEENARDKVREYGRKGVAKFVTKDGEITKAGWEQLNKDVSQLELNALDWLRKTFENARDDGHSGDELVGTVWYDPSNTRQMELLELASDKGSSERIDFQDTSYGGFSTAMDGISDFGASVLGGFIVFFDVDEEF